MRAALVPIDLRCEYLSDPLGIDVTLPHLSWRLESLQPDARGQRQTAYQVLVTSGGKVCWDSGKVGCDETLHIAYAGTPLVSGQVCEWKVRVWDEAGHESAWSAPAFWTMGMLKPEDWKGEWIGWDGGEEAQTKFEGGFWIWHPEGDALAGVPAETRYFRCTLNVPADRTLRRASVYVLADSNFVLWVNGEKAVDGVGFPFGTETDVAPMLRPGINVLAVEVTNQTEPPLNPAGLLAEVRLEFTEGDPVVLTTDAEWLVASEVGEGWRGLDFDDQSWPAARVLGPAGIAPWGPVSEDEHRRLPARMLRREFEAPRRIARATAAVCGLGFFEFYLNGQKIGDHLMDPAHSRWDKRAMYVTFDVTEAVRPGANAAGIWLGNGRFFAPRVRIPTVTKTFGYPKVLFQLHLEYDDGTGETIVSDDQWKITTDGPIRANNEFDGEEYDARREEDGWAEAGFDDATWQPAQLVESPGGRLIAQMLEPMRVTEVIPAVEITEPQPGMFLVDFGQNLYGVVRMKVRGPAGTRVQIRTSFSKRDDGTIKMEDNRSAWSTDVYTLRGHGEETWSPRFRGQGTRYAEVTGYPGPPAEGDFALLVVHTDLETTGEFDCSNELLNRIYANLRRSTRMQERSVPLDPDRDERQAWLGHPAKTSESEAHLFKVASFYRSFLEEIRIDQREDGDISDAGSIWPFYTADTIWPSVITILPDWFFSFYGDHRILEDNFETMVRWIRFQERTNLLPDFTLKAGFYGDWVDAGSMDLRTTDSGSTSRPLMYSAYFFHHCQILSRVAGLLGKSEESTAFADLAEKVRAGFLSRFYDANAKKFESETQCSYVLPLAFGLVPAEDHAAVVANLVEDIMVRHQGHLSVGLIGMQWFMQVLTDVGHPEVAYHVATRTTRPSWGYMIQQGGTSIWERWDQDTRDPGMNGESQLILAGNLGAWFYQTLAGINGDLAQPAFKHIILRPHVVGDLRHVKAAFRSPRGPIRSEWKVEDGVFDWRISIPPNTTATVHVPTSGPVCESGRPADAAPGLTFLTKTSDAMIYSMASGSYYFTAPANSQKK